MLCELNLAVIPAGRTPTCDNEKAMWDKGYKNSWFITPNDGNGRQHKLIMSRREEVDKRLRQFKILKIEFRHDRQKHRMVFAAVANLTQLLFENGEPLFSVSVWFIDGPFHTKSGKHVTWERSSD